MPWIISKFEGLCAECGDAIFAEEKIYYNGKAYCFQCGDDIEAQDKKPVKPSKGPLTY